MGDKIRIGEMVIDPEQYQVYLRGKGLEFTPKEFELLVYLARHKDRVISRKQLLSEVWDFDFVGDTRMVDIHVSHLREKIEQNTKMPNYIKTIRGSGYKLVDPL